MQFAIIIITTSIYKTVANRVITSYGEKSRDDEYFVETVKNALYFVVIRTVVHTEI